jgi:hypothetical protein
VLYGAESCGYYQEGEALDFIQDGHIELDGELPLNTSTAASAPAASTASGKSSKVRHRGARGIAPSQRRYRVLRRRQRVPIVTGATFIFIGEPY